MYVFSLDASPYSPLRLASRRSFLFFIRHLPQPAKMRDILPHLPLFNVPPMTGLPLHPASLCNLHPLRLGTALYMQPTQSSTAPTRL